MDSVIILIVLGIIIFFLMRQRWFWLWTFGVMAIVCFIAAITSTFTFNLPFALGFLFVAWLSKCMWYVVAKH